MWFPLAAEESGHQPIWMAYAILIVLVTLILWITNSREKKKRFSANQKLWEWSQKSGVSVIFGDPPANSGQDSRALLKAFNASDNPFLHPSYDLEFPGQNLFRGEVEGRKVWMIYGCRHLGKNSDYPEAWVIVELLRSFPSGEVDRPAAGFRPFAEEGYQRVDFDKPGLRAQAKNPDDFKPILLSQFLVDLIESGATGFRLRERFLEVSFDGNATQEDWEARTPVVTELARTLEESS